MATTTPRVVEKVRKVEETYREEDGVILELSTEEASYLMALIGWCVVGDGPLRAHNAEIYKALQEHGLDHFQNLLTREMASKMRGSVDVHG